VNISQLQRRSEKFDDDYDDDDDDDDDDKNNNNSNNNQIFWQDFSIKFCMHRCSNPL